MLRQDTIIRLIEQVARACARLLAKAKTEQPSDVQRDLDEQLKEMTGLDFSVLDSLPVPTILDVFGAHEEPDPARLLAVAECSFVRAEVADVEGAHNLALRSRVLALTMYLEALSTLRIEATAAAEERMEQVVDALKDVALPHETGLRLFRFRAADNRLDLAENVLFDLLESGSKDPGLVEEGRAFYHRLQGLTDRELVSGKLPRDEVLDGLAELDERVRAAVDPEVKSVLG